jgi:hypothetical protein
MYGGNIHKNVKSCHVMSCHVMSCHDDDDDDDDDKHEYHASKSISTYCFCLDYGGVILASVGVWLALPCEMRIRRYRKKTNHLLRSLWQVPCNKVRCFGFSTTLCVCVCVCVCVRVCVYAGVCVSRGNALSAMP